jgi:hypothetical protein
MTALNKSKKIVSRVGKVIKQAKNKFPRFSGPGKTEVATIEMPQVDDTYAAGSGGPQFMAQFGIHNFKRQSSGVFGITQAGGGGVDEGVLFSNPLTEKTEVGKEKAKEKEDSSAGVSPGLKARASSRADRRRTILDKLRVLRGRTSSTTKTIDNTE